MFVFLLLVAAVEVGRSQQSVSSAQLSILIDRASGGDTIKLKAARYDGNLVIRKRLILIGEPGSTIAGADSGDAITLLADSCVLKGLVIRGGGRMQLHDNAGVKIHSQHNLIDSCSLEDNLFGIYLFSSNYNIVRYVTIHGRDNVPENERGNGIHLHNSRHNLIEHVHIFGARDGIYFDFADSNTVVYARIEKLRYGLHYMYSQDNIFEHCYLAENIAGAALMYSNRGLTLRSNVFAHNIGYRAYGILFKDCNKGLTENNVIMDNTTGLFFDNSHKNVIRNNLIALSGVAIRFSLSSELDAFFENSFINNVSTLVVSGSKTDIAWDSCARGNYWSDAKGYDLDADGISDVPHNVQGIFDYLQGEYPLFSLYLYSPAAQAMQFADRTIPLMVKEKQVDQYPLMKPEPLPEDLADQIQLTTVGSSRPELVDFSCLLLGVAAIIVSSVKRWAKHD
jgi:nitrous oxidase accessory protein